MAPDPGGPGPAVRRVATGLQVLLVALVLGFAISTLPGVRPTPRFVGWLDGWYQGSAYVLIAVLALLRPLTSRRQRLVNSLVAAAIVFRVLAFIWFWSVVRLQVPQPSPSLSDAGWLLSAVLLLLAAGLRTGEFAPLLTRTLLLDAVSGALLVGGIATAVVFPLLESLAGPDVPANAVAVNLAYPLLDLALLIAAAGLLAVTRWQPQGPDAILVVGIVLFSVVDVAYLFRLSEGTFHPGTWISAVSIAATAMIASAVWGSGSTERAIAQRRLRVPGLAVPVLVSLLAVGGLAYAGMLRAANVLVAEPALVLLVLAVVVALVRGALTVTQDRELLGEATDDLARFQALVEASSDFIVMADLDYRLLYINPAGRELVGLPPDRPASSVMIPELLMPESAQRVREVTGPIVEAGGSWSGMSMLRSASGAPIPVLANTFMLRSPKTGRPVAMGTIQRDIRQLREAERALEELAEQRRLLLGRLVEAQEDERARIAEDVHDDSVQALAAVDLRIGLLLRQLGEDHELSETARKAHEAVVHATSRLRHLLFDLESPARDNDLPTALDAAAQFAFEDTDVRWTLSGDRHVDLPEASRVTAYRVVKEALVNVRKHAGATHVEITLERVDEGVLVVVCDDGIGFDEELARQRIESGHHGLANMRDRVAVAGGRFLVHSLDGGTEVRLWLPDLDL